MSKCRKLFKVLFAAVALGGVSFLATGCSSMDVSYNPNVTMHEGNALPQLVVNSNGTAVWKTDTEGKFVAGKHVYEFEYTDARTGKVKLGSFEFEASQHRSNADAVTEVKAPTCTEDGIQYHVCEICEALYNQESIPALGHDFTVPVHTDGDCMTKGYTVNKCSRCGEMQKTAAGEDARTEDTEYGAHTWATNPDGSEISETVTEPTCQAVGQAKVYCEHHAEHAEGQGSQVQDYKLVELPVVPCKFTVEERHEGDCMNLGWTEYKCQWCGTYKMVEGSTTEHYKKMDTEYGAHKWLESTVTTDDPTCQAPGHGVIYCEHYDKHIAGQGNQGEEKGAKVVQIDPVNCDFSEKHHTDGDCVTKGFTEYTCKWCHEYKLIEGTTDHYKDIDENYGNHIWAEEAITEKNPTCQETGYTRTYCIHHDEHEDGVGLDTQDYFDTALPVVPCEFTEEHYTPGDCMNLGYTEYTCKWCHEYKMVEGSETEHYKKYDTEYGAHTWAEEAVTMREATCQEAGYTRTYCIHHNEHLEGEGSEVQDYFDTTLPVVPCEFTEEHYTPGDCMNLGYTEYTCRWCHEYKMVEGSETEHYKKYDTEYGAHTWETNPDGSEKIHITEQATCQHDGSGVVYCIHAEAHQGGQGNTSNYIKTGTIPQCDHVFAIKEYEPYNITTCCTLGNYRLKCTWCDEYQTVEGVDKEYPFTDTEYLDHHFDFNGLCDNIYYQKLDDGQGHISYTTRICGQSKDEAVRTYNLGGTPRVEQSTQMFHAGTYEDPSDTVVAKIIKEMTPDGQWTGNYVLYIISTEATEQDLIPGEYKCYENPTQIDTWVKDGNVESNFISHGVEYIPWYEDIDENGQLYRNKIVRIEVSSEITSLPAALFANHNYVESVSMEGLSALKEIPTGLFYGCDRLTFVGLNDNTEIIGYGSFMNCPSFRSGSIVFPRMLKEVYMHAFENTFIGDVDLSECTHLEKIGFKAFVNSRGGTNTVILPNSHINLNLGSVQNDAMANNEQAGSFNQKGYVIFVEDDYDENECYNDLLNNVYQAYVSTFFLGKGNKYEDIVIEVDGVQILYATEENPIWAKHALYGNTNNRTYVPVKYTDGFIICNTLDKTLTDSRLEAVMNYVYNGHKVRDELICIANQAFTDCTELTYFDLPTTVREIRDLAFCDCINLEEIGQFNEITGRYDIGEDTDLVLIGASALSGTAIKKITIPNSVKYLGFGILQNCYQIEDIYYDAEYKGYMHYTALEYVDETTTQLFDQDIPWQVNMSGIFYGMSESSDYTIHIGSHVTRLNTYVFFANNGSKNVKLDLSNATSLSDVGNGLTYLKLKEIDLSNTAVVSLANNAFKDITTLERIILPSSLTTVGATVLNGCTNLKYIEINSNLTIGGNYGLCSLAAQQNVEVCVNGNVTSLPMVTVYGNITFTIPVLKTPEGYTGFSLQFVGDKYSSSLNTSKAFMASTSLKTMFRLTINDDIDEGKLIEEFVTDLPIHVVVTKEVENLPDNYFEGLPAGSYVEFANESSFVWNNNKSEFHYCSKAAKLFGTSTQKVFVDGVEITFEHCLEDLEHYVPETCENPSSGYIGCLYCDYKDETIKPAGHKEELDFDASTATCTTEGNIVYVCTVCHTSRTEVGLLPHTPILTDADCYSTEAKIVCEVCGQTLANSTVEGHYFIDENGNYALIDTNHSGETCVICGKSITVIETGSNGVITQLEPIGNDKFKALVTSCGEGTEIYDAANDETDSPIWDYRFKIEEMIIGEKITYVGLGFVMAANSTNYYKIKKLTIGSNVAYFEMMAFGHMYDLIELNYNAENAIVSTYATSSFYAIFTMMGLNSGGVTLHIGPTVKTIPSYIFYNCVIKEVSFVNGIETVKANAFKSSDIFAVRADNMGTWFNIKFVNDDDNPMKNGQNPYFFVGEETTSMKVMFIPDTVNSIERRNLLGFERLGLTTIEVEDGNQAYKDCGNGILDIVNKTLIFCVGNPNLPDDEPLLQCIGIYAMQNLGISSFKIPSTVICVDPYAFYNCKNLKTLDLGNAYQFDQHAFDGCPLELVLLGKPPVDQMIMINMYAFKSVADNCITYFDGYLADCKIGGSDIGNEKWVSSIKVLIDVDGLTDEQKHELETGDYWYWDGETRVFIPNGHTLVEREPSVSEAALCISKVYECSFCHGDPTYEYSHTVPSSVEIFDCSVGGSVSYDCDVCGEHFEFVLGAGHYDSNFELITDVSTGPKECAFCHKLVIGIETLGEDGVIGQITQDEAGSYDCSCFVITTGVGTKVTSGKNLFNSRRSYLTTIIVSDDITSLDATAFEGSNTEANSWLKLRKIVLGKGLTTIGARSFYCIFTLEELYINGTISPILVDGTDMSVNSASVDNRIFNSMGKSTENGTKVYFGKDVKSIPHYIFTCGHSGKLYGVYFEKGSTLESWGADAFWGITRVGYGPSVKEVVLVKDLSSAEFNVNGCFGSSCENTKVFFTGTQDEYEQFKNTFSGEYAFNGMKHYFDGVLWTASTSDSTVHTDIAKTYFYSEETPAVAGNYWHYAEDGFTPVIWEVAE